MNLAVETEQEEDGRWLAEIPQIPGALAYGASRGEAISRVAVLFNALRGDLVARNSDSADSQPVP